MHEQELWEIIWNAQNGKYDKADKLRHEAECPRGISVMRLYDLCSIPVGAVVSTLKNLREKGKIVVHNEGNIEMSFEAVK